MEKSLKHNWSLKEIQDIYNTPLLELIYQAQTIHRQNFDPQKVQVSSLISVKTGGCPEDCSYCPQAARYQTDVAKHSLLSRSEVFKLAQNAKERGASRVCLGAAWREVKDNKDFDDVLGMVKDISQMEMEVCCTLGMLSENQANKLKDAGLYAYNHNIDTSEDAYKTIISTRTYSQRLETLKNVRKAKLTVCSGGIIGMGETLDDRLLMLQTLSGLDPHPESVPINTLVAVAGTPLQDQEPVSAVELIRMIATARILMPKSHVRLSAGRLKRSLSEQALCFMAGANSIFSGEKLLTTPNPEFDEDSLLFETLGLSSTKAYQQEHVLQ